MQDNDSYGRLFYQDNLADECGYYSYYVTAQYPKPRGAPSSNFSFGDYGVFTQLIDTLNMEEDSEIGFTSQGRSRYGSRYQY